MPLFRKSRSSADQPSASVAPASGQRNLIYEEVLQREFGLRYIDGNWAFEGTTSGDVSDQLRDAESCMGFLRELKAQLGFSRICVIVGTPAFISCDAHPPFGFATGLNTDQVGDLLVALTESGAQLTEYQGVYMLPI